MGHTRASTEIQPPAATFSEWWVSNRNQAAPAAGPLGEYAVRRDDPKRRLPRKHLLSHAISPLVELALVSVGPFLGTW
jgi:hypothetical protein